MQPEDLLVHKSNIHSQNGEDGIIAALFERIGTNTKICCEFGAWDGSHLSNCRNLISQGWSAIMIEANEDRYKDLVSNYLSNSLVTCINKYVEAGPENLGSILKQNNIGDLDFLSIDIDGLDYEILETLDVCPRVICIEVNAGHNPKIEKAISRDIAKNNIGQPLKIFVNVAKIRGYELVCYTGNAFFVRRDVANKYSLPTLSSEQAYQNFLSHLSTSEKEWIYLVNLGLVNPFFRYANPWLDRGALGISKARGTSLRFKHKILSCISSLQKP